MRPRECAQRPRILRNEKMYARSCGPSRPATCVRGVGCAHSLSQPVRAFVFLCKKVCRLMGSKKLSRERELRHLL
jgi:hypothetical protein